MKPWFRIHLGATFLWIPLAFLLGLTGHLSSALIAAIWASIALYWCLVVMSKTVDRHRNDQEK